MKNILCLFLAFWVTMGPVLAQSGVSPNSGITVGAPKNPTTDAPTDAAYGVVVPNSSLPNARTLTGSTNIGVTDGGAGGAVTFAVTGQIPVANGGTGASTQQGAANAVLNFPGLTSQDLFYYNGTNTARFPKGSNNTYLSTNGSGNIEWAGSPSGIASTAPVLMFGTDGSASASRAVTAGTGISITDGGPMGNATFAIDSTVTTLTGTQVLTNKTLTAPTMGWNSGSGFNLAGSTFNSALKWADWAAARNLTIPDPGADASFVMTEGAQTLNGVKTFGSTPVLSTGAFTVGGNTVTVPSAADTLVNLASTQSLSNKTISAPVFTTGYDLKTGSFALQHTWDAPAANRAYVIKDVGGAAHYVMKDTTSAYTAGAIPYGDGSKLVVGSAGTSGQPLLSGGTGAYTFGTLGPTVGGTNQTTYATGDTLYASGANTLAKLAAGTNGHIMTLAAGVPTWAANAASTPTLTLSGLGIMTSGAGTLTAAGTTGDLPYFSASNTTAKLGIGSTGQVLKVAAGIPSWGTAGGGFGGDGSDGAVTLTTSTVACPKQYNATTLSVTAANTVTLTDAPCIINANSTVTISGIIDADGEGYAGGVPQYTDNNNISQSGFGPGGGQGGMWVPGSHVTGGAGGGFGGDGGYGGGGAASTNRPSGGKAHSSSLQGGSGGGAAPHSNTSGTAGRGGGSVIVCAVGAISVPSGGQILARGIAATDSTGACGGNGGGSGGAVWLISQTSASHVTGSTIDVSGGAGSNAGGTPCGGGGGGAGGRLNRWAPSVTATGTFTATGGGGGAAGGTGGSGGAGGSGVATTLTGTPNLPLLTWMFDEGGSDEYDKLANLKICLGADRNNVVIDQKEVARIAAKGDICKYVAYTMETALEPGQSVSCLGVCDFSEELNNAA